MLPSSPKVYLDSYTGPPLPPGASPPVRVPSHGRSQSPLPPSDFHRPTQPQPLLQPQLQSHPQSHPQAHAQPPPQARSHPPQPRPPPQPVSQPQPPSSSSSSVSQSSQHPRRPLPPVPAVSVPPPVPAVPVDPPARVFTPAFLSQHALFLRASVPLREHTRRAVPFPSSFTGQDVVDTLVPLLPPAFSSLPEARLFALQIARALQDNVYFFDVDYSGQPLCDDDECVYVFEDEEEQQLIPQQQQRYPHDLPTGVLTPFTICYSPLCPRVLPSASSTSVCYSPHCPLNPNTPPKYVPLELTNPDPDQEASSSDNAESAQPNNQLGVDNDTPWVATVPTELLDLLTKAEISRQNDIHSIISSEVTYLADLRLLHDQFVVPIIQDSIIAAELQPEFFDQVLLNYSQLTSHIQHLVDSLLQRQREQSPCIHSIGDLILAAANEWGDDYVYYATNLPFAKERLKRERRSNPPFDHFISTFSRRPQVRKLEFDSFHSRATHRMLRYSIQLREVLKHTPDENNDRDNVIQAMEVLAKQSKEADVGIAHTNMVLDCHRYHADIYYKHGQSPDLDLLNPSRQIFMQGKMIRRLDGTVSNDRQEQWVILFDHCLVITKIRKRGQDNRYQLSRRPVPLELMSAYGFDDPPLSKGFNLSNIARLERGASDNLAIPPTSPLQSSSKMSEYSASTSATVTTSATSSAPNTYPLERVGTGGVGPNYSSSKPHQELFPITFRFLGRHSDIMTLYIESAALRKEWKDKLVEATGLRDAVLDSRKVFETIALSSDLFASGIGGLSSGHYANSNVGTNSSHSQHPQQSGGRSNAPVGRPTSSIPFSTPEGHQLIAIGHEDGLWIGLRHDPRTLRIVLHLRNITQVSILQEFKFILILADGILMAYPLDTLVPSSKQQSLQNSNNANNNNSTNNNPERLSGNKDVLFFKVGKVGARTLVIYAKKGGVNQTVFKALEPVSSQDRPSRTGFMMRRKPEWFRAYKEFFIPSVAYDIIFLRSQLCFELLSLEQEPLLPTSFPDWTLLKNKGDMRAVELHKRVAGAKALGMYRLTPDTFIFCFDELAFYADKHGDPKHYDDIVYWESEPKSVTYYPPYVIATNRSFIEIRNAHNGQLCQIIKGQDILLTYDGQAISSNSSGGSGGLSPKLSTLSSSGGSAGSLSGSGSYGHGQSSRHQQNPHHQHFNGSPYDDMNRSHLTIKINKSYHVVELKPTPLAIQEMSNM